MSFQIIQEMERAFMNKDLIQKRFAKNLDTYNDNAKIQKKMAKKLLSFLDKKSYDDVLEIGCGTGFLTQLINDNIEFKNYTANDIVTTCKNYIKEINPNIDFVPADIEKAVENSNKKYDLIISNATFQWVEDIESFIKLLVSKLNNNGILLFSTFGPENFREVNFVLGKTLDYYSANELQKIVKDYNNVVEQEMHVMAFKTPKDILKHIKSTGVNALERVSWTKTDMQNFEKGYNNFCSGVPTLTYHPIYVKISV